MRKPVVLDLETKHTFREFQDPKKLGISVVGIYDYATDSASSYLENKLHALYRILEQASYIIGFNLDSFDMQVLQGYYPGDVLQFKTFDILEDVRARIGKRISLNNIVVATLEKEKTGHGLQAIELYRDGKIAELTQYCMDDVTLTRDVFQYGVDHGEIFYRGPMGKIPIRVSWEKYLKEPDTSDVSLTLPF